MLWLKQATSPVDYRLCNQTVTIYHWDQKETYTTTVVERAFFEHKKTQNVDKIGSHEVNSFLLVIPGPVVPVTVEDKVILGEGPEITDLDAWKDISFDYHYANPLNNSNVKLYLNGVEVTDY